MPPVVLTFGHEPDPAKRIRQRQANLIRKTRLLRDISRAELAETLGVTVGAVSQWENGTTSPRQHVQVALAKTLDVPWSMIFGLDAEAAA